MEHRYKAALQNIYRDKLTKPISSKYKDHLFPVGWSYAESVNDSKVPEEPM